MMSYANQYQYLTTTSLHSQSDPPTEHRICVSYAMYKTPYGYLTLLISPIVSISGF